MGDFVFQFHSLVEEREKKEDQRFKGIRYERYSI